MLREVGQGSDLGECNVVSLLPEVGLAVVDELLHARELIAALDHLERVKASLPPPSQRRTPKQEQRIDAAIRDLQQARDAYREVVAHNAARGLPTQLPTRTPAPDLDPDPDPDEGDGR